MPEPKSNGEIRFGVFEVIPSRGELRKHGIRIKLPDQSFTVLLVLLEDPGAVVSRDELKKRLWGEDTFTDFEHGLNAAVNRLRDVLGDSVSEPKFIETLPKRGYRFIAPVENPKRGDEEIVALPVEVAAQTKAKAWPRSWWLALATLPLVAVGGWLLWQRAQVALPAPTVQVLTSYPNFESQPCFSPDGSQVAFVMGEPNNNTLDIYVKLVGAENALQLTTDPALDRAPAWSPDGKQIAFLRGTSATSVALDSFGSDDAAIYLISPLGGGEHKLADVPGAGGFSLSWSPDGKWLSFARPSRQSAGIYLLPVAGGEPRQITHPTAPTSDRLPTFSADGRQLAYASCTSAFSCDLYLQELDSSYAPRGGPRRITQQQAFITGIAWVGGSLVYGGSLSVGLLNYLWRVNADGASVPERLEIAGRLATFPAYSPAANRLAFMKANRNFDIWRYTADGSHSPLITSSLDDDSPQFSPNGENIVFSSARTGEAYEIWVANADGSHPAQLTNQVGRFQGSPRWSPDGRSIAFDSQRPDGGQDIYVIDATGGRPRRLDLGPHQNALPSWSHDGAWIYYVSDRTGRQEIWRVRPAGGRPERVTDNGGRVSAESADGKTLFYMRAGRGSPLFARSLAGGPEWEVLQSTGPTRDFQIFEDGIYYSDRLEKGKIPVMFREFSTGASRLITTIEPYVQTGLTVSPDRKTILYTRGVAWGGDLMLIENFR